MRTYEEIRDEQARPVRQAIANAERELEEARRSSGARDNEKASTDAALQELISRHRALDLPQSTLKNETAVLENQKREIQRQIDAKNVQLRETEKQAEELRKEINRRRAQVSTVELEIKRAEEQVNARQLRRQTTVASM